MPSPVTRIEDDEDLIRRIPADSCCYSTDPETGDLRLSTSAFNDPQRKPSVDRRAMKPSLDASKRHSSDGLLCLVAKEVRVINLPQIDKGKPIPGRMHIVDAIHRPIEEGNANGEPPNDAHAQIESHPDLGDARFKKLKEALVRIAERRGWLIAPSSLE